jgi:endoglucanase
VRRSSGPLAIVLLSSGCAGAGVASKPADPATPPLGAMTAGATQPAGNNLLANASFDEGTMLPWSVDISSPAAGDAKVTSGELCVALQKGGQQTFDVVLRQRPLRLEAGHDYQVRFKVHATAPTRIRPKVATTSSPYTERWSAVVAVTTDATTFTGTFHANDADPSVELAVHLGGELAGATPLTVCFDDLEINDPKFQIPAERSGARLPAIRVNQVGYFPRLPKVATYKSAATAPVEWKLVDGDGKTVASGTTRPFGEDKAAGELLHQIDFSSFTTPGKGYKLVAGADESLPFAIADDLYRKLQRDALSFFYHQRSGTPIVMPYAGDPSRQRPAGHPGDKSVGCSPEAR